MTSFGKTIERILNLLVAVVFSGLALLGLVLYFEFNQEPEPVSKKENVEALDLTIEDGIHTDTGLLAGDGLELVIKNCTNCHSSKLIIQNRATRDGWKNMIHWMQETQGLWPLRENEKPILDYLTKNYAPVKKGRRQNLTSVEWYEITE